MAKTRIYTVIGLGTFGRRICEVLHDKGAQVIAIDHDAETVERIKNTVTTAIQVDATDETTLMKAPLDDVDVAIVAIGDDIQASILTTAILKRRGIPYIVARAVTPIHQVVLTQVGANEVVNLEIEEGERIAQRLIAPEVLDTVPLTKDFSFAEVLAPKTFVGKSISRLQIREKFRINVVAIRRAHVEIDDEGNPVQREELVPSSGEEILADGDVLLIVGRNEDLDEIGKLE